MAVTIAAIIFGFGQSYGNLTETAPQRIDESEVAEKEDTKRSDLPDWWWNRLKQGTLHLNDTTVIYPKFIGFCVDVYNWADRTFNSYDTTYVVGTGKRWKAMLRNDNWVDSYAINLHNDMPMRLTGDMYCNVGFFLQYMAVSAGYSLDLSNVIGNKPTLHKKMGLGFTCALFTVEGYYNENTGGSYLRTFGDYNRGRLFKESFPGVRMVSYGIDAYYFFNHRRYSHGAAYNFSKYQKKNAGSVILGFTYGNRDITLDFTTLPEYLQPYLRIPAEKYKFHYSNYCVMAGYGYNLVFGNNWLFNSTVIPSVGVNRSFLDSLEGEQYMLSLGMKAKLSLTWNISDIFVGMQTSFDGSWYLSNDYSLLSSIEDLGLSVGVRF